MNVDTRTKLHEADDPLGYWAPGDDDEANHPFPWKELIESVKTVQKDIKRHLGLDLKRDGNVQDATFLDELFIRHPSSNISKDVIAHIPSIAIRFSNFGRLYTIYSDSGELDKYPVGSLKGLVDSHGWKFVDRNELTEQYDGVREDLKSEKISWWRRYFDYL